MGKGVPIRPDYVRSVGALIAAGVEVRASCTLCAGWRVVDLAAIAATRGADFSLWNKRARCRLTPGCAGVNRFRFNARGRSEPLWD